MKLVKEREEFGVGQWEKSLLKKEIKIRQVIYKYFLSFSLNFKTTATYLES